MEQPIGISKMTTEEKNFAILQLAAWPQQSSIDNLFNLYHKYVALEPSNKKCGICKNKIKTFWINYLK